MLCWAQMMCWWFENCHRHGQFYAETFFPSAGEMASQSCRASALGFCSSRCSPWTPGPLGGPCPGWQGGFPAAHPPTKAVSHLLGMSTVAHDEPSLVPTPDFSCLENRILRRSHLQFIKQISNTSGHL